MKIILPILSVWSLFNTIGFATRYISTNSDGSLAMFLFSFIMMGILIMGSYFAFND